MNDKHQQVQRWLETVFGDEDVPQYEMTPTTVETLWNIMKRNKQQDKAMTLVSDDLQQKATEYSIEEERLGGTLSSVGLSTTSLSQSGAVSLRTLIDISLTLHTRDTSDTSLMLAMTESCQATTKVRELRKLEEKLASQLLAKTKTALMKNSALIKALSSLGEEASREGPELEKKITQAAFLQRKGKEYRKQIALSEKDLRSCGVDPTIYHGSLLRRSEELQDLRERLHPLRAKLDSYQQLPPDLALARVKLAEVKQELKSLEEDLGQKIDLMHM